MSLTPIVSVVISLSKAAVTAAGFGVPMIVGSSNRIGSDRFRAYSSLAGMAGDGYLLSDPEYLAAQTLLSQDNPPPLFLVGRRLAAVAQTGTININTDTNADVYTANVNGTACSFTSLGTGVNATATGLAAAIQAQAAVTGVGAVAAGPLVTMTAQVAGNAFTCTLGGTGAGLMTLVNPVVANHGLQEDLSDIRAAGATWYGTMIVTRSSDDILNGAAWTEANAVPATIFVPQTSEAASADNTPNLSGTDVANKLKAKGYKRSALWWHTQDSEYLDAGMLGRELPVDPGSDFWGMKSPKGVTPLGLNFSETRKNNLIGADYGTGKNANIYIAITPSNAITQRGTMASGDWIDAIRFIDFLVARISEAAANRFLTQERIELTDFGIAQLASDASGVLQAAKDAHKLDSFSVTAPRAKDISSTDRQARRLNPPITFAGVAAAAFGHAAFTGQITE